MARLDSIPQMLLPVMLTLSRGNPPVKETVSLETTFDDVALNAENVKEYANFCGFQNSADFPATWLYLLAQRAQIALMLNSKFPLAAPGIVHLTNSLEMLHKPDLAQPISLKTSVSIEGKASGSLFPQFRVDMLQSGTLFAVCTSGYIAKRGGGEKSGEKPSEKSGSKQSGSASELDFSAGKDAGKIVMPDGVGWDYAKVSGDFNPIHIAGIMAKAFGLPGKLAHGWYSVSMFASVIERIKNISVKKVDVQFQKPVLLPNTVALEYLDNGSAAIPFRITSVDKKVVHLTGSIE
ncbi:MAG: MaoC/PaaZ C-terminal domain-containing protein [Candidatus Kapaibacteriota bacterium]|jgi:hypothetical protein